MKLGFSTWAMPDLPIETSIEHLAKLGYDGITIAVLPRFSTSLDTLDNARRKQIKKLTKENNLPISSVMSFSSMLEENPSELKKNIQMVQESIRLAVDWDTPYVITGIGGDPGELEDPEKMKKLIETLENIGDFASSEGITVALEPHVGQATETPDQLTQLLDKIQSPFIKVNFDISHFNVLGIPMKESVDKVLPYSVLIDVKDERGIVPDWEFVAPGEGEFNYAEFIKTLDSSGYDGFVTVEISFMVQKRSNYDPLEVSSKSFDVLNKSFKIAGVQRS